MAKDFYKTLGVEKNASQDDIKKAFRKLAHQYHPDKNNGDDSKFKEVNEAYQVLSDEKKRAQYDRFGEAGVNGAGGGYGGFQGGFNPNDFGGFDFSGFQNGGAEFEMNNIGDIFNSFFGGGMRQRTPRGRTINATIEITFYESIFGTEKTISLKGVGVKTKAEEVVVKIPPGIEHGETLRVREYGEMIDNGTTGDLHVYVSVRPDKVYRKVGANLVRPLEVKLTDALLGAEYEIETLEGKLTVKIPSGLQPTEILRVKEKGVPLGNGKKRGDLLLNITIKIPEKLSKKEKELIEKLREAGI